MTRELAEVKEKRKSAVGTLERELEQIKKEKNDFQTRFYDFQKKVVDLENINESLEGENRASKMMLSEYEHRVEKTMEELAMLQTELEEKTSTSEEQIARLRNQLKETEEELYVVHLKHQKHNDESEHRRSRISSMSNSVKDNDTPRESHVRESIIQLPMASTLSNNQENLSSNINGRLCSLRRLQTQASGQLPQDAGNDEQSDRRPGRQDASAAQRAEDVGDQLTQWAACQLKLTPVDYNIVLGGCPAKSPFFQKGAI